MTDVMSKSILAVFALFALSFVVCAQAPTGTITGTVVDASGAAMPNVTVTITEKATGAARSAVTNASGLYSAPALPAGDYEVRAEAQGFRTLVRESTVQAGGTFTVNLPMSLGEAKEVVSVEAASTQINYETNSVQGVIDRSAVQDLPLNGRSYMQLAVLEPGVTIASGSTAQFNALFTVSILGGGNRTTYTADGGNISDSIDTGGGTSSLNLPQDVVQEFQLSSVNFDIGTDISSGGAINIVTRSGTNQYHGSAYFYYRDHNMSAYPGLQRPRTRSLRAGILAPPSAAPSRRTSSFSFSISSTPTRSRRFSPSPTQSWPKRWRVFTTVPIPAPRRRRAWTTTFLPGIPCLPATPMTAIRDSAKCFRPNPTPRTGCGTSTGPIKASLV